MNKPLSLLLMFIVRSSPEYNRLYLTSGTIIMNFKYIPSTSAILSYFAMLIIVFMLFFGRTKVWLRIDPLMNMFSDFYHHISNFSISYLLFSGIGFMWLLLGVNFKYIIGFGIAILLCNFVYELWVFVLNTPDIIDAYYGFWGTFLAFLFLFTTEKYGLTENESAPGFKRQNEI